MAPLLPTITDLLDDERRGDMAPRPDGLCVVCLPLDDLGDVAFWENLRDSGLHGTPLYYRQFPERKPERCAAVVSAVVRARPGGVLVHCGIGRDRTGLVVLLLLALAGVGAGGHRGRLRPRLLPLFTLLRIDDQLRAIQDILPCEQATSRAAVLVTLKGDSAHLRRGGVREEDLAAVRHRLCTRPMPSVT
ncbi:tyrosine-protein phosphatase [Microbispora sp. NPDC046933]|uniref:tyrosine-protein phosphatase n=1 Tax=Microbispora sp. NPDC046933 TaxID=3155618 RepID=UPI0033CBF8BC